MSKFLTEEKIAEFRTAFGLFDKEGTNKLSIKELTSALTFLKLEPQEKDVKEMLKKVDKDGKGNIGFTEFLELLYDKMNDDDPKSQMMETFRIFDRDGNGFVSKSDLKEVMHFLGEDLNEDELDEIIKDWDEDGDGQLNYEEFETLMTFR